MQTTKINCPKCNHEFNVEDVLLHRLEEEMQQKYNDRASEMEKSYQAKDRAIKQRELEVQKKSEDIEQQSIERAKAIVAENTPALKAQIEAQATEKYETQLKSLTESEAESKKQLAAMKSTQIENERLKRQNDEKDQEWMLKLEQAMTEFKKEQTALIQQRAMESTELKIKERDETIEALKKSIDEMKRKAEQGSTQMQGEVQEIALEKMLRDLYEIEGDAIEEVKKGQRGADVVHVVKTRFGDLCGKICYESKRTKKFDESWLQKLRDDNLEVKADILVIVTEAMPPDQDRFYCKDGVWICSFWEVKGLSMVLRYAIMQAHNVSVIQQGKETKMEMIYDYLTSNEFAGQFGAILEGFDTLRKENIKERQRLEKACKEREKQLEKIMVNAARFYGSIKGIAGQSIPNIQMLEDDTLPDTPLLEG
jgi:hypothetical protein